MREICDKYGILLISDEVMSGWGEPGGGSPWTIGMLSRHHHHGEGSYLGYVPLGAVIVREKIAKYFDDKYLYAGLTYSGMPWHVPLRWRRSRPMNRRGSSITPGRSACSWPAFGRTEVQTPGDW